MRDHRFTALGGWGSKATSIAGWRCLDCGFMFVAMNHAADAAGHIRAIGENGEDLEESELVGRCSG